MPAVLPACRKCREGGREVTAPDRLPDAMLGKPLSLSQSTNRFKDKFKGQRQFNLKETEIETGYKHSMWTEPGSQSTESNCKKTEFRPLLLLPKQTLERCQDTDKR